jgi:4-hydroxy-4-methyl-2-oxoglutarate aldolase
VISACSRDLWALHKMNFPVFGTGATPADSLGRLDVTSIGGPIKIDGVRTKNGDYILGNIDGVVIIPLEIAEEAIKLAGENTAAKNWRKASLLPKCSVNTESCNTDRDAVSFTEQNCQEKRS